MQSIDNVNATLKTDLQENIKKGSKIAIAAACFSMHKRNRYMVDQADCKNRTLSDSCTEF